MFLISMAVAIQYRSIRVATWHSGWYHYSDGIFPFHPKDGNVSASLSCQLPGGLAFGAGAGPSNTQ